MDSDIVVGSGQHCWCRDAVGVFCEGIRDDFFYFHRCFDQHERVFNDARTKDAVQGACSFFNVFSFRTRCQRKYYNQCKLWMSPDRHCAEISIVAFCLDFAFCVRSLCHGRGQYMCMRIRKGISYEPTLQTNVERERKIWIHKGGLLFDLLYRWR